MNSPKTETFLGMLATALIAAGLLLYAFDEPARLESAQAAQLQTDLDEAMTLYAENCSVCHGLAGEGIGPNPSLDNPGLSESDPGTLFKIITRGLYGTSMPAWGLDDGGPLSDYQIGELVDLTRFGDWQATQDRVVNLGLAPLVPFAAEPDPEILEDLADMPEGDILAQGITVYAQQCVACHGADGLGTSLAPPLNDPAVSTQSIEELERTLLYGVPGTLMAGWENALSSEEVNAVVTLMTQWDQVDAGAIPTPEVPIPVTTESLAMGADLYAANCSRCHADAGQGTQRAPSLNVKGYLEETSDAAFQQIITLGVPETSMPAWGDKMTEAEIQAIVGFMRAWEPTAPEVAEPVRGGGGPWWQTEGDSSPGRGGKGNGRGGQPTGASVSEDAAGVAVGRDSAGEQPGPPVWAGQDAADHTEGIMPADGVFGPGSSAPPAGASPPAGVEGVAADHTPAAGQGGPPEDSVSPGLDSMAADQTHKEGPGGLPEWAAANSETSGQGHAEGGEHDHAEGEIPPWATPNEQPQSWWESMDSRAWAVVLGSVMLSLTLMTMAFFGLRRLPILCQNSD